MAAELIFVGKKRERGHFVLFQPPLNYGKRDDKKKSLLFQRVLLGPFSPVCVCDPVSFLMISYDIFLSFPFLCSVSLLCLVTLKFV